MAFKNTLNHLLAYACLLFSFFSCTTGEDRGPFPKTLTLQHHKAGNFSHAFTMGKVGVAKDYVVVCDFYSEDTLFYLLKKQDFTHLGHFGIKGNGPGEVNSPGFFALHKPSNTLYLPDLGRKQVAKFDLDAVALERGNTRAMHTAPLPNDLLMVLHFLPLSDSVFVTQVIEGEGPSLVAFGQSGINTTIGPAPSNLGAFNQEHQFVFGRHPTENRFACAYLRYGKLVIVDKEKGITGTFEGPDNFKETTPAPGTKRVAYGQVVCTKKYIYATYLGKEISLDNPAYDYGQIQVYDWEGSPVANILLGKGVASFDIDVEYGRIVAYTLDEENPLVYFDFQEAMLER